nr:MAG TPA: hypothetical protein [Caudoviricetes sp.]
MLYHVRKHHNYHTYLVQGMHHKQPNRQNNE